MEGGNGNIMDNESENKGRVRVRIIRKWIGEREGKWEMERQWEFKRSRESEIDK